MVLTDDAANTSSAHQSSRAKRTLPLAADVVCLPREDAGDVCVARTCCKEYAKIANSDVFDEAEKSES